MNFEHPGLFPWQQEKLSRTACMTKTATGLVIGRSYIPPAPRDLGHEGERIQAALLHKPPPLIERVADAFDKAMPPLFGSLVVSGLAYGLARMATS